MAKKFRLIEVRPLQPGERFEVEDTPKCNAFPPGTKGFVISYNLINSRKRYATINAIITRKGKSGKERLTPASLSVDYFKDDDVRKTLGHPIDDKKYGVSLSFPEKTEAGLFDVRNISSLDFIGWAACKVKFLSMVNKMYKTNNQFLRNTDSLLHFVSRITEGNLFDENSEANKIFFEDQARRAELVDGLRLTEAQMARSILRYFNHVERLFQSNLEELSVDVKDEIPGEVVNASLEASASRVAAVESLINKQNKI